MAAGARHCLRKHPLNLSWQADFAVKVQRESKDTLDARRSGRLRRSFYTLRPLARDSLTSTP
jgi:hypothetical protein